MKYQLDEKLRTHYMWFDGPIDLLDETISRVKQLEKDNKLPGGYYQHFKNDRVSTSWPGRTGRGWVTLRGFLNTPWPHAMALIDKVVKEVREAALPDPKDTRRKMKWSDDAGEVDVYRAMDGEAEYMRRSVRTRVSAPPHVTLLCNLDYSHGWCNESGVWYRSAVGMAVADKLESLGYGVDIVVYNLGTHVYPAPNHLQLVACRPKKAGDPVDFTALCDTMSEWFTSEAFFASYLTCPVLPVSLGGAWTPDHDETDPWATQMAPWLRLLDLEVGTIPVLVPMATGAGSPTRCAQKVLERVRSLTG